jgi:gluconate 2-dehydrogenase gamma chain
VNAESPPPFEEEAFEDDGDLTRRGFLGRTAAVAGGITMLGGSVAHASRFLGSTTAVDAAAGSGALSSAELATLTSVLAQLLPPDSLGPGAVEAGVPTYINRSLAGSYKPLAPVYQALLSTIEKSAEALGASFSKLSDAQQIELLTRVEAGDPPGISASEATSVAGDFQLLLEHMREGMFGDPMYGGNIDLAGWKLIGYPDIQLETFAKAQEIDAVVKPSNKTAQSYGGKPYNGPPV